MPDTPFRDFARHYDRFMLRYVDYPDWVNYVARIFGRFRLDAKTVLDLACGTGIPTLLMAKRGYLMTGVDRSAEMLAVLEGKRMNLPVETLRADMTDFELPGPVDAAISLYDSVNYLLTDEDLLSCFRCVRRAVRDGGLFAFDMNTVYSLAVFWGNRTTPRSVGNIHSIWHNSYDQSSRVSTLDLTFWERHDDGTESERYHEVHRERAFSKHEVKRSLKAAGFGRVWFYTHGGFLPVGPLTTRMMCVAR